MHINFSFKKQPKGLNKSLENSETNSEFSKAVTLFTNQRKKCGFSLEELSKRTKISRNVLISIENGSKRYLPEQTYLVSMTKKLEAELSLEIGSLNGISSKEITTETLSKFKFININFDFLNSGKGRILYFILMLLFILALNSQQQYLLKLNSLSTQPISTKDHNMEKQK